MDFGCVEKDLVRGIYGFHATYRFRDSVLTVPVREPNEESYEERYTKY